MFDVASESQPGHYRVDLAAFSGFGACTCLHWSCRLVPRLKSKPPLEWRECKHIAAARRFLAIAVAQRIIQQRSRQENPKMTRRQWAEPPF